MIVEHNCRPVRVTGTGIAISRQTVICGISVRPAGNDLVIDISDAKSPGDILHSVEADAASGSHYEWYNPGWLVRGGVHLTFSQSNDNQSATLFVVEPNPTP